MAQASHRSDENGNGPDGSWIRPPTSITDAPDRRRPWRVASYDDQDWRHAAACRLTDQSLFFPTGTSGTEATETIERAKRVCAACPVQLACLHFALTTNQEFGVWGGCDEDERHRLRREWRAALSR